MQLIILIFKTFETIVNFSKVVYHVQNETRSVREHVSDYPSPEKRSLGENRYVFLSIDAREKVSSQEEGGRFVPTLWMDVVTRIT